jgi:hypothetical protein
LFATFIVVKTTPAGQRAPKDDEHRRNVDERHRRRPYDDRRSDEEDANDNPDYGG